MKSALLSQKPKKRPPTVKEVGYESDVSSSSDEDISSDSDQVPNQERKPQTKGKLPVKVSKDAKETMQECTTEFIMFLTSEANDMARDQDRITIGAEDILKAMDKLGFDRYHEFVQWYYKRMCSVKT